jgi:hypothetical protein
MAIFTWGLPAAEPDHSVGVSVALSKRGFPRDGCSAQLLCGLLCRRVRVFVPVDYRLTVRSEFAFLRTGDRLLSHCGSAVEGEGHEN